MGARIDSVDLSREVNRQCYEVYLPNSPMPSMAPRRLNGKKTVSRVWNLGLTEPWNQIGTGVEFEGLG